MTGHDDDASARRRGAVPPPPSQAPGDAPETIEVPRMDPPPPSLEAMVERGPRMPRRRPEKRKARSWLPLLAMVVLAALVAGITAYVTR